MHPQNFAVRVSALGILLSSCAPGSPVRAPLPVSDSTGITRTSPLSPAYLRFSPGRYRYRLTQTAEVRVVDSLDSAPSTITTRGLLLVEISTKSDTAFEISVSADSISVETQGAIPQAMNQTLSLDSILSVSISPSSKSIMARLPDSLCAYGHLVGLARELILLELGFQAESPAEGTYSDSSIQQACRAGMKIEVQTARQLRDRGKLPMEFEVEQTAIIRGAGILQRDSVTVAGSTTTRGNVSLIPGGRLPAAIQTQSDGTVTVRLGHTLTVFRQVTKQNLELEVP